MIPGITRSVTDIILSQLFSKTILNAISGFNMVFGKSHVEAPRAFFTYSPQTHNLQKILLNVGVKLFEENKKATCDELEFNLEEDRMTLRGKPYVVQDQDEIRGQEIVFTEGGKKMKINQATLSGEKK